MVMKRNVTVSIAAVLMVAAGLAQASDILVAGEFASENVIVESTGMTGAGGGSYEDPVWKEQYPFPRNFSRD
jgi:hypothetical protein